MAALRRADGHLHVMQPMLADYLAADNVSIANADRTSSHVFRVMYGTQGVNTMTAIQALVQDLRDYKDLKKRYARLHEAHECLQMRVALDARTDMIPEIGLLTDFASKSNQSVIRSKARDVRALFGPHQLPVVPTHCIVKIREVELGAVHIQWGPFAISDQVRTNLVVSGHYMKFESPLQFNVNDLIDVINDRKDSRKLVRDDFFMANLEGGFFAYNVVKRPFHTTTDPMYDPDEFPELLIVKGLIDHRHMTGLGTQSRTLPNSFDSKKPHVKKLIRQMIETDKYNGDPTAGLDIMTTELYLKNRADPWEVENHGIFRSRLPVTRPAVIGTFKVVDGRIAVNNLSEPEAKRRKKAE